ncbi:sensor histidine kinase [Amorphus orientalis]|uniref:histidine kinase n=1 Tax=Amorphus orientalis TaxID=649198 RepID=A0AAE3VQG1_9HYPH|nr:sensor histidine kinase [Amorphus orientalis]MDQ0315970.1 Na+/proline symporter/nitrogen-specific signal transduction histidine kinase [Amorphus orientalis]
MLSPEIIVAVAALYLSGLFVLAFVSDRRAERGAKTLITSPVVYTLSLAVYCTSWTFYGAVGSAARNGVEFATIYIGPTFVFVGWWLLLRKLVRISRTQQITSIADFISARYGKSSAISAVVTIIAIVAIAPYIALQLKAVATSFEAITKPSPFADGTAPRPGLLSDTGFWVAACMAAFVILFGTRKIGADESHPGVVAAIAFESMVKLFALVAVGVLVVAGLASDQVPGVLTGDWSPEIAHLATLAQADESRWIAITFLSAAAIICLPRQFQVAVVENQDERHLTTAAWLFPLYLLLISLFVVPIAIAGMKLLPIGSNPDLYVLTVPLAAGYEEVAILAFIGGLSAGTSMVILSSIALSIMISNHLVTPLLLRTRLIESTAPGDLSRTVLLVRRLSIVAILAFGYLYYRTTASTNGLASIGLISFVGVAQFLPALVGGVFWRRATRDGALAGLLIGFALWAFTLLMPSLAAGGWNIGSIVEAGPFELELLRPTALFGLTGLDPLVHSLFWSLGANVVAYVFVSIFTVQSPIERLQSALFVDVFARSPASEEPVLPREVRAEDLYRLSERILGADRTAALFEAQAERQGRAGRLPLPDPQFIALVERQLASGIGASSAGLMVSRIAKGEPIAVDTVMALLDETREAIRYSRELERKSVELERIAGELRSANEKLTQLDRMKDDFLSRVSHELRTPMTSIRSFAELLAQDEGLDEDRARRFIAIIDEESRRLTRLLDEILDLNRMESGEVNWTIEATDAGVVLSEAMDVMSGLAERRGVALVLESPGPAPVEVDADRLKQVLVNILSNAIKFNTSAAPAVTASVRIEDGLVDIRISDNGPGISADERAHLFTKFGRAWTGRAGDAKGSGLGLAISMQIMRVLSGDIRLVSTGSGGSEFSVTLPVNGPLAETTPMVDAAK